MAYKYKPRPVLWLSALERCCFARTAEYRVIERYHQLLRQVIKSALQTHHHTLRTSSQETTG